MSLKPSQLAIPAVLACVATASAVCGATPQDRRMPHERPQGPRQPAGPSGFRGGGAGMEGRSPRAAAPLGRGGSQRLAPGDPEGRLPRPGPVHRTPEDRIGATTLGHYPGTRVIVPPAWNRCTTMPDPFYWRRRDLMAEIQWLSRSGFIPVTAFGDTVDSLTDYVQTPAGWRAYGLSVPAGGTVQIEVQHPSRAWFRLMLVDKWGAPGAGMMRTAMAHQPVLTTFTNPHKKATAVYVIVDDPAWWSDARNPYTLVVRRNWDPLTTDLSRVKLVAGLWGATPSVSARFQGPSLSGPAVYPH